jgi:hypothetical protein
MTGHYWTNKYHYTPEPDGKLIQPRVHMARANGNEVCRDDNHHVAGCLTTTNMERVTCAICKRSFTPRKGKK